MVHQFVVCFLPYTQYQAVTLSAVSLKLATKRHSRYLKRKLMSWQICLTLVSNFKYQLIAIWNVYKKECVLILIATNFGCFSFHVRRANYQTFIWKSRSVSVLNLPSPIGNGWKMENETFCEEHMLISSLADTNVELTRCKCKKSCKTNSCCLYN